LQQTNARFILMFNYTEPDLLESALERYCHIESSGDWQECLKRELSHPKFPHRHKEFRHQLAYAILNRTISPTQYEKLTELELETEEEVIQELTELWMHMYGDEPVKLENL
jgi:hypothetical protein